MNAADLRARSALVTGGAGFIGSHLVDALIAAGVERITVLDDLSLGRRENLAGALGQGAELTVGDCADLGLLRQLAAEPFDLCFNLAVIPLPHSLEQPRANVDRNVAMTSAVCELGREGGYRRLVQYSSSEVYGTGRTEHMDELHPIVPHTPYAAAKAATDHVALSYAMTFGLPVVVVRPFNTYGPRQNDGTYAGLIPAVVRRVEAGEPVIVNGDGEQTRDMCFVTDSVRGTLLAAAADDALGEVINLGTGEEATVNEMVRSILDAMGRPGHPIEHGPERPGDVRRLCADVSRAERLVGFRPQTSLADGMRLTVEWYLGASASTAASA